MSKKKEKNCRKYFIIYETTNLTNSKVYRGKYGTYTPYEFDGYLGSGIAIKAAIKKYGRKNFKRETLFVTEDEDLAYLKEAELVDAEFVAREDTYNLCTGGNGFSSGKDHFRFGVEVTKETRKKMSDSAKGKIISKETRKKISDANSGENCSEETRKKMSNSGKGRKHTKETLEKMRFAKLGILRSEETKNKISVTLTGTHRTQETKDKISVATRGERNPMFGEQHTPEAIAKMSGENHWNFGVHLSYKSRLKRAISSLGEETFYQRLKDIEEIDKEVRGWYTRLSEKWGIARNNASHFVKSWYNKE